MLTLIKDVLEYSRLTKAERRYVPVDMDVILQNVMTDFDLLIEQKNAKVEVQKLGIIDGIPLQINQLFHNLLSNSLKFAAKERDPHIQIKIKRLTEEEVAQHKDLDQSLPYIQIEWQDNGIGFSEEHAEQIFVIFQRLNDRGSYSGTGIGLAMCKRIATNHRGEISVRSAVDKGSTFFIVLPAKHK
jgi:signal transduction histidine kinase